MGERTNRIRKGGMTYGNPSGNEINLVKDINQMFMCLFLPQVLDDGLTPRTQRISCIQDMDNDIGRIENFVELTPDTSGCTLGIDRLTRGRGGGMVDVCQIGCPVRL